MRKVYNKLVRDRIPEIIKAAGNQCSTEVLSDNEYQQALRQKLIEEAHEAATATGSDFVKELADLYEVIDGLMAIHDIDRDIVMKIQEERRAERGSFNKRFRLLWAETR